MNIQNSKKKLKLKISKDFNIPSDKIVLLHPKKEVSISN
jgi:hypothetical protein